MASIWGSDLHSGLLFFEENLRQYVKMKMYNCSDYHLADSQSNCDRKLVLENSRI